MAAPGEPLDWARELADRLAAGRASPAGALDAVLSRLEATCGRCTETLASYPRRTLLARVAAEDEAVLERAAGEGAARALDLAADRDAALELFEELLTDPRPQQALARAVVNPRFHRWGFAVLCCEWVDELLVEEPPAALAWAKLAVATADALDPAQYGTAVVDDLRGLARSALARAFLPQGDGAGKAAIHARRGLELLARGSRPAALWSAASLAAVEVEVACGAWTRALTVADLLRPRPEIRDDPELSVRLDRLTAAALCQSGALARARWTLRRAIRTGAPIPGPAREHARLASTELAHLLCDAGRFQEAGVVLERHTERFPAPGPDPAEAHRAWARGRWLAGIGSAAAGSALQEARDLLAAAGEGLAAARAAVDHLAWCLDRARTGEEPVPGARTGEPNRPLAEVAELYALPTLPPAAKAALLTLQCRSWQEGLTAEAIETARSALALPPGSALHGAPGDGEDPSIH
ncbi:MAG: hypothetical protein ACLF0P_13670 [Thermoanaerobaculia bacterium]